MTRLMRNTGVFSVILLIFFALAVPELRAQVESIYIDPQDGGKILQTTVPFETEVVLSVEDLPKHSQRHPGVILEHQKFIYLNMNPQKDTLAFSVVGEQHSWTGLYRLKEKELQELALVFEGTAGLPYWSGDGRYLAVEEGGGRKVKYLEIFDVQDNSQCRLEGKDIHNKFLNLTQPWWSPETEEVFFKVEYNNFYRKSLGLKTKDLPSRIGKADVKCEKTALFSVKEFMDKFPQMAGSDRISLSGGDQDL